MSRELLVYVFDKINIFFCCHSYGIAKDLQMWLLDDARIKDPFCQ
jgi:hypothetical protein